jgi:hypothetical protein
MTTEAITPLRQRMIEDGDGFRPPLMRGKNMLALSDDEMTAIADAANPIPYARRAAFLEEVGARLGALPERGPGATHRVIREAQHKFLAGWLEPR